MLPDLYNVRKIGEGMLSVMAKPVAGEWIEDEFDGLKMLGVDRLVCLLEKHEQAGLGLAREEELCLKKQIIYTAYPIPDRGVPDMSKTWQLATELVSEIRLGAHVVIHCRAGIGRTGIVAGAILVTIGQTAGEALSLVSAARGVEVPDTNEQIAWLERFYGHCRSGLAGA